MPMHDWTRVDAGLYHDFHQSWAVAIKNALNGGALPAHHFALVEQHAGGPVPDVLTLQRDDAGGGGGGTALAVAPGTALAAAPRTRHVQRWEADVYVARASRIAIRHRHGEVVAVIELVSPGNKVSKGDFDALVGKSAGLLRAGVNLLIVDPFPPGRRDPDGVHSAIWGEFIDEPYALPPGQPLAASAYDAAERAAYVEPFAVGEPVPDVPLFLLPGRYVTCPLAAAYEETWRLFPAALKGLLG